MSNHLRPQIQETEKALSQTKFPRLTPPQGTGDNFYKQGQLLPENFIAAAKEIGQEKGVKRQVPTGL